MVDLGKSLPGLVANLARFASQSEDLIDYRRKTLGALLNVWLILLIQIVLFGGRKLQSSSRLVLMQTPRSLAWWTRSLQFSKQGIKFRKYSAMENENNDQQIELLQQQEKQLNYIEETVLKKRKSSEENAIRRKQQLLERKWQLKNDKKLAFKRAEEFIKEYRHKELEY